MYKSSLQKPREVFVTTSPDWLTKKRTFKKYYSAALYNKKPFYFKVYRLIRWLIGLSWTEN